METYLGGWKVLVGGTSVLLHRPGNHSVFPDAVLYPRDGEPISGSVGLSAAEAYIGGQAERPAPTSN